MDFRPYYSTLNGRQREAYAKRAKTTVGYIETHLLGKRKIPRKQLMERLATASKGKVSYEEVLAHFYSSVPEKSYSKQSSHLPVNP